MTFVCGPVLGSEMCRHETFWCLEILHQFHVALFDSKVRCSCLIFGTTGNTKRSKKKEADNVDVILDRKIRRKKRKKKPQKSNFVTASTNAFGHCFFDKLW